MQKNFIVITHIFLKDIDMKLGMHVLTDNFYSTFLTSNKPL